VVALIAAKNISFATRAKLALILSTNDAGLEANDAGQEAAIISLDSLAQVERRRLLHRDRALQVNYLQFQSEFFCQRGYGVLRPQALIVGPVPAAKRKLGFASGLSPRKPAAWAKNRINAPERCQPRTVRSPAFTLPSIDMPRDVSDGFFGVPDLHRVTASFLAT
jgi:hypothetical protein